MNWLACLLGRLEVKSRQITKYVVSLLITSLIIDIKTWDLIESTFHDFSYFHFGWERNRDTTHDFSFGFLGWKRPAILFMFLICVLDVNRLAILFIISVSVWDRKDMCDTFHDSWMRFDMWKRHVIHFVFMPTFFVAKKLQMHFIYLESSFSLCRNFRWTSYI